MLAPGAIIVLAVILIVIAYVVYYLNALGSATWIASLTMLIFGFIALCYGIYYWIYDGLNTCSVLDGMCDISNIADTLAE